MKAASHKKHVGDLIVRRIPLAKLKPWPRNPRKAHAVDAIARSIEAFGYLAPVIVQRGTNRILAGHGRLEALRKHGVHDVPCIVADIDDDRADLYTLADNKLVEAAEWDFGAMAGLLLEFDAKNLDVSLTGFDAEELERIANWTLPNDGEETKPIPEPPAEAVTKTGDIWELGKHRLMCADSTKAEDVARLMQGEKAGLMNTDPPYGIGYDSASLHINGSDYGDIENDKLDGAKLQAFLEASIRMAVPHLRETCAFYLWHPMLTQGTFFAAAAAAAAADILVYRQIIWTKPQMIFGRGEYHWKHELCFFGWRRGHRPPFFGERNQTTVWDVGYDGNRNERDHPTAKPIELFTRPILNHTAPGEVVYEPFAGSGSQIIAAEKLGRRCYAMEIEPRYVQVSIKRWQNFTGKKAKNLTRPNVEIP